MTILNMTFTKEMMESKLRLVSFNCNGFKANHQYIRSLTQNFDIIFLCETWLLD